jgi:hypothetical protein
MLRFGSASAFALQQLSNMREANARFQSLIKYRPDQRLSSRKGVGVVRTTSSRKGNLKVKYERGLQWSTVLYFSKPI